MSDTATSQLAVKDLTTGPIGKQLLRLAAPIVGGSFIQMAYNFTDMAWLGRLGSKEVAAVGVVGVLLWLAYSIATLTKVGSEVCVAQAIGAKDSPRAASFASHNFTLSTLVALGIIALYYTVGPLIVQFYHLEPDSHGMALRYLYIVTPGLLPLFLSVTMGGLYNAAGQSTIPFRANAIGLVLNMILDPLFIFVCGWKTEGAALATTTAEVAVFLILLYRLRCKDRLFSGFPLWVKLQRQRVLAILKVGVPVALLNSLFAFVSIFMGRIVALKGSDIGVAVLTAGGQLEAITWNASQGFSTALGAFVGQNYASGKIHRVRKGYRSALLYTSMFGLTATLLFLFAGEEFFSIFVPDAATYVEGGRYLYIAAFSQLFIMVEITTQGLFYGVGKSGMPAIISIVGNYARIPVALLLIAHGGGLAAIWWTISMSSVAKGLVAALCLPWLFKKINSKAFSTI